MLGPFKSVAKSLESQFNFVSPLKKGAQDGHEMASAGFDAMKDIAHLDFKGAAKDAKTVAKNGVGVAWQGYNTINAGTNAALAASLVIPGVDVITGGALASKVALGAGINMAGKHMESSAKRGASVANNLFAKASSLKQAS